MILKQAEQWPLRMAWQEGEEWHPPSDTKEMYRGMRVTLPPEIVQAAHRNDPETGHHVLNWLGGSVGRHWSTEKDTARNMGHVYYEKGAHDLRLTGELPDPQHRSPVMTPYEQEVRMQKGAPVNVTGVEIGFSPDESMMHFPVTPRQMSA